MKPQIPVESETPAGQCLTLKRFHLWTLSVRRRHVAKPDPRLGPGSHFNLVQFKVMKRFDDLVKPSNCHVLNKFPKQETKQT